VEGEVAAGPVSAHRIQEMKTSATLARGPFLRGLRGTLLVWVVVTGLRAAPDAIVAADGSGQYTTIQAAVSAAADRRPGEPRWTILVKPGIYRERVYVQRERGYITLVGEDAAKTILTYDLNANLKGPDDLPIGTFRTPTLQVDGDGFEVENLTIANSAGPVGQALALRVDGDRVAFRRCRFLGWQDTILVNRGRQYFEDCYIEGHVDFIFGGATAWFQGCRIHCLRDGYITAASTPQGQPHGFVFSNCEITGAEGVRTYLGRPWRDYARTVFLRTAMSGVVRPEGWHNWNKPAAEKTSFYAEFGSIGPGGEAMARTAWSHQLTSAEAAALTREGVLAGPDDWKPWIAMR
jgi:pectinesterase